MSLDVGRRLGGWRRKRAPCKRVLWELTIHFSFPVNIVKNASSVLLFHITTFGPKAFLVHPLNPFPTWRMSQRMILSQRIDSSPSLTISTVTQIECLRPIHIYILLKHRCNCSQDCPCLRPIHIYIPLKLSIHHNAGIKAWDPYIFTSLSNASNTERITLMAWDPYIFTSLSNKCQLMRSQI